MIAHFAQISAAICACALMVAAAIGAGGMFDFAVRDLDSLLASERLAMRFLAGCGAIALIIFLIGQIYFSSALTFTILFFSAALNFFRLPKIAPTHGDAWLWFAGFLLMVCAISGLAQPVGDMGSDETAYHLLGPVVWLREKKIAPIPHEALTAFPATIEVLFAMVRSVSNDRAPGLLGVVFFGFLLLQTRALALRLGADQCGTNIATALLAAMPAVTGTIDRCFVDAPFAAFAIACARLAFDAQHPRHIAFAGMFAGFCAATKYTGLPLSALTACVIFFQKNKPKTNRALFALAFLLFAALAGCAWYLRNWFVFGNPIYPPPELLWRLMPTPSFPLDAVEKMHAYIAERGRGMGKGALDFLLLPFRLTYHTEFFHGGGGIGVGPLAFAPIGFVLVWKNSFARTLAVFAALLGTFWFFTDQEVRFLDAPIAIACALAGIGCSALLRHADFFGRSMTALALAVSLIYGATITMQSRAARLLAVASPARERVRAEKEIPHADAFEFLNNRGEVKKTLLCDPFTPAYYFQKTFVVPVGRWGERPMADVHSAADCARILPSLGVTHVLDVDEPGIGYLWPPPGPWTLVFEKNGARIYEVKTIAPRAR